MILKNILFVKHSVRIRQDLRLKRATEKHITQYKNITSRIYSPTANECGPVTECRKQKKI